jgi:hypothetical protein
MTFFIIQAHPHPYHIFPKTKNHPHLHRYYRQCKGAPIRPWTACQGAKTLCIHSIWTWDGRHNIQSTSLPILDFRLQKENKSLLKEELNINNIVQPRYVLIMPENFPGLWADQTSKDAKNTQTNFQH